ncbi:MAG: class II fumarate hydratase [Dermatophilaceae bacterium]
MHPLSPSEQTRSESDSLGPVEIPAARYWGPQTQRCLELFDIGRPSFGWGRPVVHALGLVKRIAAEVNLGLGVLPLAAHLCDHLVQAAREVEQGGLDEQFPLGVFQTGSGTQTNMNANEVIAGRANELATGVRGGRDPVHPNDHVNLGQSSNDIVPTVMNVAVVAHLHQRLYGAVEALHAALNDRADAFADVVKVGRTHLQDATPMTVGQEFEAWSAQLSQAIDRVRAAEQGVRALPVGGTAVGTGLNTHPEFGAQVTAALAAQTGIPFRPADNLLAATAAHDDLLALRGALRSLAVVEHKIAGDIRWLASGPNAGLGELLLPANEPGSSIMPGKVNPSQAEALQMVCARVVGNDAAALFAAAQPSLQLHVGKPLLAHCLLESISLLAEASESFARHCVRGIQVDEHHLADLVARDAMLATALAPHIGYDRAAQIVRTGRERRITVRDAALASGQVSGADFDRWVDPRAMARPRG